MSLPRRLVVSLVAMLSLAACGSRAVDATPTGAVRAFVEAMQRDDDPHAREEAYRLMCPAAQIALAERARGSAALGGRTFEPWEMIAEDRSLVLHAPRRSGAYRERVIEGEPARRYVDVIDDGGQARPIEVSLVEGSWCVELVVPEPESG
ncbi:MAG: hypothetical protein J0L92_11540 [Deltaproteobacteria bacterium]|nr:hypothetical protein [Deltaproteobacteria bacterium]